MKAAVIFAAILIILSTAAGAYTLTSTHAKGTELALGDKNLAFITYERTVDSDLTNDGDTGDYVLRYYDLSAGKLKNTGRDARHPSVYDDTIAYEDKARVINLYDTDSREAVRINERGTYPSIFGRYAAFVTAEKDEGLDLNDDGDQEDSILRYYNSDTGNTTNTEQAADRALAIDGAILLSTDEGDADEDLNRDNDRNDKVMQYLDIDSGDLFSLRIKGENPVGYEQSPVIITDNGEFLVLDIDDRKTEPTGIFGNNPSFYGSLLAYDINSTICIYNTITKTNKCLNITGTEPEIYGSRLAFADENREVAFLDGDDEDNDDITDFADNCPSDRNKNQEDSDKDGIGDACETAEQNATVQQNTTNTTKLIVPIEYNITITHNVTNTTANITPQLTAQVSAPAVEAKPNITRRDLPETTILASEKKDDKNPMYWFLVAIGTTLIGLVLLLIVPRWMRRRRKSFGF
jgi:hypothetical protein